MTEIFDESDALEKTAGDRKLLSEVIRFTLEDVPGMLSGIEAALGNGNLGEVSRLAHKVKGSAGACGARKLYLSALDLELTAREGDSGCADHLPEVDNAFRQFGEHPAVKELASLDPGMEASIG